MIFPPSVMKNVHVFDVEAMKAKQDLSKFDPDKLAQMRAMAARALATPPDTRSNVQRVQDQWDKMESSGALQRVASPEKLRASKAYALQEARFTDENGFRRQVTTAAKALYRRVSADRFDASYYKTREDALTRSVCT